MVIYTISSKDNIKVRAEWDLPKARNKEIVMKITPKIQKFLDFVETNPHKNEKNFWPSLEFQADNNMTYGKNQKFWKSIYRICLFRGDLNALECFERRNK